MVNYTEYGVQTCLFLIWLVYSSFCFWNEILNFVDCQFGQLSNILGIFHSQRQLNLFIDNCTRVFECLQIQFYFLVTFFTHLTQFQIFFSPLIDRYSQLKIHLGCSNIPRFTIWAPPLNYNHQLKSPISGIPQVCGSPVKWLWKIYGFHSFYNCLLAFTTFQCASKQLALISICLWTDTNEKQADSFLSYERIFEMTILNGLRVGGLLIGVNNKAVCQLCKSDESGDWFFEVHNRDN